MSCKPLCDFDTGHTGNIHDAQLDFYGRKLATASSDATIKVWDLTIPENPRFLADLKGHEGPVWQVSWAHPKFPGILASCSYDRQIIIWKQINDREWVVAYKDDNHRASVNSIQWAPFEYGLILAAASSDGSISMLSFRQPDHWTRTSFHAHGNGAQAVSWASAAATENVNARLPLDGARIVTGGADNAVRVWRFQESTEKWFAEPLEGSHSDWVRDVAFRPSNAIQQILASCSQDGTVLIWAQDPSSSIWKPEKTIRLQDKIWRVSFSTTGGMLMVSSGDNTSTLFKKSLSGEWEIVTKLDDSEEQPQQQH
eukprot:GEMP01050740.1.p1 GENE.GEMP01050740.1~~GEMP01050740.1.p1  ORF type:complete len:312 (+),score=52.65 GEMP01050740.1:144-1079(+)